MQSAYIINDRTGKPYAVVGILPGGTEFYPIAESAVSWASWMTQDFAAKKITKQQLSVTLDNSMSVEGPMPANRTNKAKIDELIKKAKKVPKGESDKEETEQKEEKSLVPVLSLMDVRLDALENSDWRNAVNFKAKSLLTDSNKSTFAYEVKRTRAAWDPGLAIPGTDRRGGWRCPPGTRYGGQITDRFGRNCGWGVARRLANEISDLGERLENVGDRRRERRVNRRNERVARRLVEGGRVERAARAVGNALESTPGGERERRPGIVERAAGRLGDMLETTAPERPKRPGRQRRGDNERGGLLERAAGRLAEALESDSSPARPAPRRPRPAAPQARPARPRQPRRDRTPEIDFPTNRPNNVVENRQRYLGEMIRRLEEEKKKALRNRPEGVSDRDWKRYKEYVNGLQHQFGYGGADRFVSVQSFEGWAKDNGINVPNAPRRTDDPLNLRQLDDNEIEQQWVDANIEGDAEKLDALNAELKRRGMREPAALLNAARNNSNPRRRRPRRAEVDNVTNTPVPAGAPRPNETLEQYKRRKYNEHNARVRKIQEQGGRAGMLRYAEWEQFHGPAVEENWNRAQARNAGRGARRAATDAGAARTANRRPAANAEPDVVQPQRRVRRPFNAPGQRGYATPERARQKREQLLRENPNKEYQIIKHNDKYFAVERMSQRQIEDINNNGGNIELIPDTPNSAPRPNVRPVAPDDGEEVVDADLKPSRPGRKTGQIGNVDQAIKHLHDDDGNLEDVKDGIVIDAVLDENLKKANGQDLDRKQLIKNGFSSIGRNVPFENKRYKFELVKSNTARGIWDVVKVEDKKTGEIWYMKTSQYGVHDGLMENIGMRAAQALEFGNDENHLRLGEVVTPENGRRPIRWIMMRDAAQWDHGRAGGRGNFVDAGQFNRAGKPIEPRDAARMAVLDFVLNNEDRHGGNFMMREGDNGVIRLAGIDHGLLGAGRLKQGEASEPTPAELRAWAARRRNTKVADYARKFNNGITGLKNNGFRHDGQRGRELFTEQARRSIKRLEREVEEIFDIDRIERNGVKLTSIEKAHLDAMKTVAVARLEYLKGQGLTDLVQIFN